MDNRKESTIIHIKEYDYYGGVNELSPNTLTPQMYTVQPGDSLYKIANKFGTTLNTFEIGKITSEINSLAVVEAKVQVKDDAAKNSGNNS